MWLKTEFGVRDLDELQAKGSGAAAPFTVARAGMCVLYSCRRMAYSSYHVCVVAAPCGWLAVAVAAETPTRA